MKCCILGLGVFGRNLALNLAQLGAEVLGIDPREENISLIKDEIDSVALADFSDPAVLENFPIKEMDAVTVAIGDDFEKSISLTIKAQSMKARRVVCRVLSPMHERLLRLLKVDRLVVPEEMAARGLAHSLLMRGVENAYEMGDGYSIVEARAPKLKGASLQEQGGIFKKADVRIVTIKRAASSLVRKIANGPDEAVRLATLGVPALDEVFREDDVFVLFGREKKVRAFLEEYGK
ncbi:MAG: TrkA family potassium uptake protein [Puniceicoccales bacterium]|jgi:trk system potassium uptake protein TrkA|nr:TrkA family potassium uptake protein [Puniceicoccales bacterium]